MLQPFLRVLQASWPVLQIGCSGVGHIQAIDRTKQAKKEEAGYANCPTGCFAAFRPIRSLPFGASAYGVPPEAAILPAEQAGRGACGDLFPWIRPYLRFGALALRRQVNKHGR